MLLCTLARVFMGIRTLSTPGRLRASIMRITIGVPIRVIREAAVQQTVIDAVKLSVHVHAEVVVRGLGEEKLREVFAPVKAFL